jgi:hypothetical protein
MRLVLAIFLLVVVLALSLSTRSTFDEDNSPSASWSFTETLSILLREQNREAVLASGVPRIQEREKTETVLLEELIAGRIPLEEAIRCVRAARSPKELRCLLERLRHANPGKSDDEQLGNHLIAVVKEWGWCVQHGYLPCKGPPLSFESIVAELEEQLNAYLLKGPEEISLHADQRP